MNVTQLRTLPEGNALTDNENPDKVSNMDERTPFPPVQTVLYVGARAIWLHMAITGPRSASLTPRDRDVLTLVATRPNGATLDEITDLLRRNGTTTGHPTRWVQRLIAEGWLSASGNTIDLPAQDRAWLTETVSSYLTPVRTES